MLPRWDGIVRICKDKRRLLFCAKTALTKTYDGDHEYHVMTRVIERLNRGLSVHQDKVFRVERAYRSYVLEQTVEAR